MFKSRLRSIRKLESANSVTKLAVFMTNPGTLPLHGLTVAALGVVQSLS
jgi:hypothetical protein